MVHEYEDIIVSLRNNLKKIINLYEEEKEKNNELSAEINALNTTIEKLTTENKELEQKYENNKIAKAFIGAAGDNHDAKIKVNRIVREIDKCIALLNK